MAAWSRPQAKRSSRNWAPISLTREQSRRVFCRPCIDWSERRAHLAGAVGAALADRLMALRWIARKRDTRALTITPIGWGKIEQTFGCSLHDHTVHARPALRVVAG